MYIVYSCLSHAWEDSGVVSAVELYATKFVSGHLFVCVDRSHDQRLLPVSHFASDCPVIWQLMKVKTVWYVPRLSRTKHAKFGIPVDSDLPSLCPTMLEREVVLTILLTQVVPHWTLKHDPPLVLRSTISLTGRQIYLY